MELKSNKKSSGNSSDHTHIVLAFDDTKLIGELFGQFDQNLALIEQRLGVDAIAKGNQVEVKGSKIECENTRKILENLYGRLQLGHEIQTARCRGGDSAYYPVLNRNFLIKDSKLQYGNHLHKLQPDKRR